MSETNQIERVVMREGHPGTGLFYCRLADGDEAWVDCDADFDDILIDTGEYADGDRRVVAYRESA